MKKKLVSVFLTLCMVLTLLPTMALATGGVMTVQIGSGAATPYQSFEAGWNAAVGGASGEVTVTLLADWTAQDGSFGTGAGFGNGGNQNTGGIRIPKDKTIILDLNGKTINRGLTTATDYGSVIRIAGGTLTIQDSSTSKTGKITGGYNNGGGAVDVVNTGGSLVMTGGSITGNKATSGGAGGSYVDGDCKGFTMTGGSITNNRCRRCYEGTWCFRFGKGSC